LFELGIKVVISYLLGSVNGALFLGHFFGVDIRKTGSGNAGGTNALRTQGKLFAMLVMLVDIGKGALPVLLLPSLPIGDIDPDVSREWLTYACAGAAVFGHCYPVWYQFRGGKGAATMLGVVAAVSPILILPSAFAWFGCLFLFGYVGLATIAASFAIPLFVWLAYGAAEINLFVFTLCMGLFIAFTHRSNIRKLLNGEGSPDFRKRLLGGSRSA